MSLPDFLDEFDYVDNATISGLVSPTNHQWTGSGSDLPYISNNKLMADGGTNYSFTDIYAQPFYQYVDFVAGTSGVVLMTSSEGFNLINMTHFRFTLTTVFLEMRGDIVNQQTGVVGNIPDISDPSIVYGTAMVTGQTYRVGVYHHGNQFIVDLPDGTQYEFASPIAASVVGQYLAFQMLNSKATRVGCTLNNRTIQAP